MKKYVLTILLFTLEAIVFYNVSLFFNIETDLMIRYAITLFVFLLIFNHFSITSSLIWDEIKSLFKAFCSYTITTFIIVEPEEISFRLMGENILLAIFMFVVCLFLDRFLRILLRPYLSKRTLVIGTGYDANRLGEIAGHNRFALTNVIGYVKYGDKVIDPTLIERMEKWQLEDEKFAFSIFNFEDLDDVIFKENIQQVIIALPNSSKSDVSNIMTRLHNKVDEIKYLPSLDIMMTFDSKIQDFDGMLLISTAKGKINLLNRVFKRIIDIISGICGLVLLIPLTLFVKRKNRQSGDDNPIFFIQERIGLNGKPIKIYKFRTMVPNAEYILEEMMASDPKIKDEYLKNKKIVNDPRITKIGEFLRKSSLDEFPQFINVLKGEMSLVGPRPYLYREKKDMDIYYDSIIQCKPGITGMWQANGRSDVGFAERCKLDDYYFRNWTIWLDMIIIYKTIKSVLYGKGAL
ncbi:exopolysaccharide biosynthesis polyprenyl glycosylphosphotransferase [Amedibacillus sp. YH-ame10]